ncbi:MAG: M48 family metalloprotease [Planctomycetes bacterium]|nr:M48 family metalloprotease [Planctomycetota bacterium]
MTLWNVAQSHDVRVYVLDSDAVAAYARPERAVYLTHGLVTLASDQEIAAAVAHELGHLLDDGYLASPVALTGLHEDDPEIRADALGCCLLQRCGIPTESMVTLLEKVKDARSTSRQCRDHIDTRIRLLLRSAPF